MTGLEKRRALHALGQRAIDYYVDTGLCVFCDADDCQSVPHEDHCNVGELSGVVVDADRVETKAKQRVVMDHLLGLGHD
jgi:hypothetical protein